MDFLVTLLAIALPALLGRSWLGILVPLDTPGRTALIWGNGLLIGLLVIPLLMRLLDAIGASIDFLPTASLASALIGFAGLAYFYYAKHRQTSKPVVIGLNTLQSGQKALFVLLALLITSRLIMLGLELLGRPLFPWDATMHWATKSRVWFEAASIVPFVDNDLWLRLGGEGVFTDHHPDYPITIPLLQVWMNSATGQWNESLMNLPWLLCLLALAAAFYGQLRASGSDSLTSIAFTYLLVTMPLLNTHVALAGYADLFLGACYCAAIMAFHNWTVTKRPWQAVLALIFAFSCPLIKNEGFYWLLTFFPALIVVLMPGRRAAVTLALLALALLGLLMLFPRDLAIAGHSLDRLNLHFRPGALAGIAKSVWVHDSWHLFGYLLISVLPLALIGKGSRAITYLGIGTALACAIGLFMVLFLLTGYASGAIRFTAVGRISLHLVPSLLFLGALMWNEILRRQRLTTLPEPESPAPS
jgi:hypothetical protein